MVVAVEASSERRGRAVRSWYVWLWRHSIVPSPACREVVSTWPAEAKPCEYVVDVYGQGGVSLARQGRVTTAVSNPRLCRSSLSACPPA